MKKEFKESDNELCSEEDEDIMNEGGIFQSIKNFCLSGPEYGVMDKILKPKYASLKASFQKIFVPKYDPKRKKSYETYYNREYKNLINNDEQFNEYLEIKYDKKKFTDSEWLNIYIAERTIVN